MTPAGGKQFFPLEKAAEILCTRWTLILIRELIAGSVRFNDLRRGVPKMSSTLLSQRLKELESVGVIERRANVDTQEYHLTEGGRDLLPVVDAMSAWGQRWAAATSSLANVEVDLLMWDIRRNLKVNRMPKQRTVIKFEFRDQPPGKRNRWLIVEPRGKVGLLDTDPSLELDLHLTTDLYTMSLIWMGHTTLEAQSEKITFSGLNVLFDSMHEWLGLQPLALVDELVA